MVNRRIRLLLRKKGNCIPRSAVLLPSVFRCNAVPGIQNSRIVPAKGESIPRDSHIRQNEECERIVASENSFELRSLRLDRSSRSALGAARHGGGSSCRPLTRPLRGPARERDRDGREGRASGGKGGERRESGSETEWFQGQTSSSRLLGSC